MQNFIILFIVVAGVAVLARVFGGTIAESPKGMVRYKYGRKSSIMTASESKVFARLLEAFGSKYFVIPQVHLSTILDHQVKGQNWKGALAHIQRKSVDYILCDKVTLAPVVAIELDDYTHQRPDRMKRDTEVEGIFEQSSMKLVRILSADNAEMEKIEKSIS